MITWAYIAGFFDGDGCVTQSNGRVRIQLTQAGDIGYTSLRRMGEFLSSQDIICTYSSIDRNIPNHKITHYLWISQQADVIKFLREVAPWIRTKREKMTRLCGKLPAKKPVDWDYVAGLFDAEGCWTKVGLDDGHWQYTMWDIGMTGEASRDAFIEIQAFLKKEGVKTPSLFIAKPSTKGTKEVYRLRTHSRGDTMTIANQLIPRLVIKRVLAQDILRYLKMFPKPPRYDGRLSNPKLIEEYRTGLSLKQIANKYDMDYSGISRRFSRIRNAYL